MDTMATPLTDIEGTLVNPGDHLLSSDGTVWEVQAQAYSSVRVARGWQLSLRRGHFVRKDQSTGIVRTFSAVVVTLDEVEGEVAKVDKARVPFALRRYYGSRYHGGVAADIAGAEIAEHKAEVSEIHRRHDDMLRHAEET